MNDIIQELQKQRKLVSSDSALDPQLAHLLHLDSKQLYSSSSGWLSWSFSMASHLLSVAFSSLTGSIQSHPSSNADNEHSHSGLLIKEVFDNAQSRIMSSLAQFQSSNVDSVLSLQEFQSVIQSAYPSLNNLEDTLLVLSGLKRSKIVNFEVLHAQNVLIKVLPSALQKSASIHITDADKGIYVVKQAVHLVEKQNDNVLSKIQIYESQIKSSLQRGNRQMAILLLKQKKVLEQTAVKQTEKLHNLQIVLMNIQTAANDVAIVNALKSGNDALKSIMRQSDLNIDSVDRVMDEINELSQDLNDIDAAISQQPSGVMQDLDDDELMAELDQLLLEEEQEKDQRLDEDRDQQKIARDKAQEEQRVQQQLQQISGAQSVPQGVGIKSDSNSVAIESHASKMLSE
ncbi:hypothetical protein MIR68_012246 [Amoeboaphelidium protococcarum]|nr:hypothetical protein MIR68_012246 [Amoeboaphelidium protococcarum]